MSSTPIQVQRQYADVNIGSVGDMRDGATGRQFNSALIDAISSVQDEETRRDKEGYAVAEITVKIRVGGKLLSDSDMIDFSAEVSVKTPGYRGSSVTLQPVGGEYRIDTTPKPQQRLFEIKES